MDRVEQNGEPVEFEVDELTTELEDAAGGTCSQTGCTGCKNQGGCAGCTGCSAV